MTLSFLYSLALCHYRAPNQRMWSERYFLGTYLPAMTLAPSEIR